MITIKNNYLMTNDGKIDFNISKNDWFNFDEMIEAIKNYSNETIEEYEEYFGEIYHTGCIDTDTIRVFAYLQGE